jgi:hypothetical protein
MSKNSRIKCRVEVQLSDCVAKARRSSGML